MANVTLQLGPQEYEGWKTVTITRSMEQISGTFNLSLTDKWQEGAKRFPIVPGVECKLLIDGTEVITGYVDDVSPSYGPDSHGISISGRDKTGDLVDCSAGLIEDSGTNITEWKNRNLFQIVFDICKPFGIVVFSKTNMGAVFEKIDVQQGETAFQVIARLCRSRGVLPVSDGQGNLILTSTDPEVQGQLTFGSNILQGSGQFSLRDRFSEYHVKGIAQGKKRTNVNDTASSKAIALDPAVTRYRPLILMAEEIGDKGRFMDQALFTSSVRAGQSQSATYKVRGWLTKEDTGPLWEANKIVSVVDPFLNINREMMVTTVTFSKGPGGTTTDLKVMPPEAFKKKPLMNEPLMDEV